MSKFEPQALVQNCWNCRHADKSVIYTSYPAQIRCNLFGKLVFENQTECLEDKPEEAKKEEQYTFVEGETEKGWNAEQIKTALTTFEKEEASK